MFLLFTINEGLCANEAAVAQQILYDIRDRVVAVSVRQQQPKAPAVLSSVMHEMAGRPVISQQTMTAEDSDEGMVRLMDYEVEQTAAASQHAVPQLSGMYSNTLHSHYTLGTIPGSPEWLWRQV